MTAIQDQPTTEGTAFPGSRKTYLQGSREDLKVPMREVVLSTGDSVVLYDTSGPYTDTALRTDGTAPGLLDSFQRGQVRALSVPSWWECDVRCEGRQCRRGHHNGAPSPGRGGWDPVSTAADPATVETGSAAVGNEISRGRGLPRGRSDSHS